MLLRLKFCIPGNPVKFHTETQITNRGTGQRTVLCPREEHEAAVTNEPQPHTHKAHKNTEQKNKL